VVQDNGPLARRQVFMLQLPQLLGLSVAALLLGAFLGLILKDRGWGIAALKGLMASFMGGLIFLHLLPHAYELLGARSLLFVLGGFLFMVLIEKIAARAGMDHHDGQQRFFTAEMLWMGLILHQLTDGVGLAVASTSMAGDEHMALAVLAHRVPVAAVVIWLFHRQGGLKKAWLRIAAMGLATIVGALFAERLSSLINNGVVDVFYAFIAGSFLHLLTHDFLDHHAHSTRDRRSEFLAFVAGIALLIFTENLFGGGHGHGAGHDHGTETLGAFFPALLVLVRETSPYLLLGLIISGLLHAYMPMSPIAWLQKGGPLKQSAKGMLFGLPLPICSCGVLPLFLSLARKGVPPACLVAFLIATPELGIDSFLLSVKLLGWKFSVVRLMVAMVLPIVIALVAVRFLPDQPLAAEPVKSCCKKNGGGGEEPAPEPWWRFSFFNLVDDIFPFVFFGLVIAALAETLWPAGRFSELVGQWDVIILGLLGIPFYVCASASVPFAMVLLQHGFSVGSVVVFLFAGPATNVATVLTVNKAFGKGTGLKLATTAFFAAILTGFLINGIYTPEELGIFEMHDHGWTWLNYFCVGTISMLGVMSLYRSGPLHWISTVVGMIPGVIHHPATAPEDK